MQIVKGKWVDVNENPIDERTSSKFLELGRKVKSLYGERITHDRIKLVSQLSLLNEEQESTLAKIIEEGHLNKLIG